MAGSVGVDHEAASATGGMHATPVKGGIGHNVFVSSNPFDKRHEAPGIELVHHMSDERREIRLIRHAELLNILVSSVPAVARARKAPFDVIGFGEFFRDQARNIRRQKVRNDDMRKWLCGHKLLAKSLGLTGEY